MPFRSAHYRLLQLSGLLAVTRRHRTGALILCYHNVVPTDLAPGGDPGLHMALPRFHRQIQWLATHYQLVSLKELVHRLRARRPVRSLAAVTFDDGYAGVFTHALPLLQDLGIPAAVFIVADAPGTSTPFWWDHPAAATMPVAERCRCRDRFRGDGPAILSALGAPAGHHGPPAPLLPADWAMIAGAARSGVTIGAHSARHRVLPRLSDAELHEEVATPLSTIASRLGVAPEFFAYPYGLWTDKIRGAVAAAGYRAALTLDSGFNTAATDLMALHRLNVPASIDNAAFDAWTAGLRLGPRRER